MVEDYRRELVAQLRAHRYRDPQIVEIVAELPELSDEELIEEFGTAEAYATSFPKGDRTSLGHRIIGITMFAVVGVLAVRLLLIVTGQIERSPLHSFIFLGVGVVMVIVSVMIGRKVDRRPLDITKDFSLLM